MHKVPDPEFPSADSADHDRSGTDASPEAHPSRKRRYQVVAVVGAVAVLGAGVLVAERSGQEPTVAVSDTTDDLATTPETLAGPTVGAAASGKTATSRPSAVASPRAMVGATTPGTVKASVPASAAPTTATKRPPAKPPATTKPMAVSPAVTVTDSGSMPKDHHTLRVVSARKDLTGYHELGWAADSGHAVGAARCTQNFRIGGPNVPARVRPTMLLCWRTSQTRSVYVLAVDIDRKPSEQTAVATITKVWAKLG